MNFAWDKGGSGASPGQSSNWSGRPQADLEAVGEKLNSLKDCVNPLHLGCGKSERKVDAVTWISFLQLGCVELCLG